MNAAAPALHLGLDLDNTLVDYRRVFRATAREWGLIPAAADADKTAIRERLRRRPGGEALWRRLQAEVYAGRLQQARLMPGAAAFLRRCRERGVRLSIVSHKTRWAAADPRRRDLRVLALAWLERRGLLDPGRYGLDRTRVHFTDTRAEKLRRIAELGCTDFVDDLPEVLADPAFPPGVRPHLLRPGAGGWRDLEERVGVGRAVPC